MNKLSRYFRFGIPTLLKPISIILILLLSASCVLAWPVTDLKITPENPCVNEGNITITGKVGPNDYVPITTIYEVEVPVSNGKYEYDAGIVPIPSGIILCSISAEGVNDLTVSTNVWGLPISKTQVAKAGKATLSAPYIPKGKYSLVVSGNAAGTGAVSNCNEGNTDTGTDKNTVKLTFIAKMEVKADNQGYFKQVCCTDRPVGEYVLKVGDKTKIITLRDCSKDNAVNTDGNTIKEDSSAVTAALARSSGTGMATIMSSNNTTVGNESVMPSPQDSIDYAFEDTVKDQQTEAGVEKNSFINVIMNTISSILNRLGF